MALSTTTAKNLYVSVWIFTLRRKWKGKCESVVPGAYCQSNTIHPANVTHSIRGSKTLSRRRPTTAPQERSGFLSKSSFFLFVSFQLCNEQLQRGITTNFKQGQIKVHSPKPHHILSKGKVYSTLITLLFPSFFKVFLICPCIFLFFHRPLLCYLSLFSPSLCSSVICSKGLRVGYSDGCYGVWPQFSTQFLIMLSTEWVTVCVWDYMRLLSLYCMTSPICLDVGVWGHTDPSGECEFPGYPEWPHPWKALQGDRGTYCTVTSTQPCMCSHRKAKRIVCVLK